MAMKHLTVQPQKLNLIELAFQIFSLVFFLLWVLQILTKSSGTKKKKSVAWQ